MNPLDRINQLNNEVALLRSQLSDARKQLESDSATISNLAKDKQEFRDALSKSSRFLAEWSDCLAGVQMTEQHFRESSGLPEARILLSRHA